MIREHRSDLRRQKHLNALERLRDAWLNALLVLSLPSWRAVGTAVLLAVILWVAAYTFGVRADLDSRESRLLTLWQVQAAFAGIALPFLLYVIEHANQESSLARRTSEVLIRRTFIFPVLCLVLALTLLPGLALQWFPQEYSRLAGTLSLFATVCAVLFAYVEAIRLLSNRHALRERSIELLEERLEQSMDLEVDRRLGGNLLRAEIDRLGIAQSYLTPSPHDKRLLILKAPRDGVIVDVNLWALSEFVQTLPQKVAAGLKQAGGAVESEEAVTRRSGPPTISLLKQYGERFGHRNRGLIALRRDAFKELNQRALENQLATVFSIGDP